MIEVLIAEDMEIYKAIMRCWEADGLIPEFNLTFTSTLEETAEQLESGKYDCLILDLYLNSLPGTTIAAIPIFALVLPIIISTGSNDPYWINEVLEAGAKKLLPKVSVNTTFIEVFSNTTKEVISDGARY